MNYVSKVKTTGAQATLLTIPMLKNVIDEDNWLDDIIINNAQHYIKRSHPLLAGFQDTILGSAGHFTKVTSPFVQIIYTGNSHWLCASNIYSKESNEVLLYDSLIGEVTSKTKAQLQGMPPKMYAPFTYIVPILMLLEKA